MRALVSAALVAGCYAPKAPAGAPCDLAAPSCPAGQRCVAPGVCATGPLPVDAAPDGPSIDAPPDAQSEFVYKPSIVACINPAAPSPAACSSSITPAGVTVDGDGGGHPWDTFIRVHIDASISGRVVTALRLQMTATDGAAAMSPNAGDVYRVQSFTLTSLGTTEPAKADPMRIAASPGAVAALQTVEWPLPIALATPSTTLYLELESTSTDGADYWDLTGATPPQLIVDVQ